MNICLISYHSCPYSPLGGDGAGGMSVYIKELSELLTGKGDTRIDIFSRSSSSRLSGSREVNSALSTVHLKAGPQLPVEKDRLFGFLPEFIQNLETYIRTHKKEYDLVYSHYWLSGLAGEWIQQNRTIPLVHTYHTLAYFKSHVLGNATQFTRRMAEDHLAETSDFIISSSKQEKHYLIESFGRATSKVDVIHPGVNASLFFPEHHPAVTGEMRSRKEDIVFLYVGRIEPVKGLMTIVEAFSRLKQDNSALFERARLVVIGGGFRIEEQENNPEIKEVKAYARERSLDEKVLFLGSRDQSSLRHYYGAADCLVVPSLYESFGLVVIEALACGVPVIVSRIGEMQSFIRHGKNGYVFQPENPVSLSESMGLLAQRGVAWSAEEIRKDVIGRVSWEKTAGAVRRVFKKALKAGTEARTRFRPGESPRQV